MSQGIIFDYYQYKNQTWTCDACGWTGLGSALEIGEVYDTLHELDCPQCHIRMGCVPHPTIEEARANWANLPEDEKRQVEYLEKMVSEFDRVCLKTPEQLPDITEADFVLVWDAEDGNTVIKHQGQPVFVEPIIFEGFDRFEVVVGILKARYGDALKGVHPTRAAYETLCGDKLGAGNLMKTFHYGAFGHEFN